VARFSVDASERVEAGYCVPDGDRDDGNDDDDDDDDSNNNT